MFVTRARERDWLSESIILSRWGFLSILKNHVDIDRSVKDSDSPSQLNRPFSIYFTTRFTFSPLDIPNFLLAELLIQSMHTACTADKLASTPAPNRIFHNFETRAHAFPDAHLLVARRGRCETRFPEMSRQCTTHSLQGPC